MTWGFCRGCPRSSRHTAPKVPLGHRLGAARRRAGQDRAGSARSQSAIDTPHAVVTGAVIDVVGTIKDDETTRVRTCGVERFDVFTARRSAQINGADRLIPMARPSVLTVGDDRELPRLAIVGQSGQRADANRPPWFVTGASPLARSQRIDEIKPTYDERKQANQNADQCGDDSAACGTAFDIVSPSGRGRVARRCVVV